MAEKVEENKRVKISDRSVGSSQLFQNKTLNPTVGAGGQYTVQVETPAKSGFTRLAEGLSTINPALQAVGEKDMARSDLALQQAGEMTLEEAAANAQALKDTEDSLYKQNGWIDRLTRTGKASSIENPLTFSRAQRLVGTRVGAEEYRPELVKRLQEKQLEFRRNGTPYVIEDVQNEVKAEMVDKYAIQDGFSIQRGFDSVTGKVNAETRARYIDEQARVGSIREIGNTAEQISVALMSGDLEQIKLRLPEIDSQNKHIDGSGYIKSWRMALSDLASKDNMAAQRMVTAMRDGDFKGIKMGGFELGSAAFDSVLDATEDEIDRVERREKAELGKAQEDMKKVWVEKSRALNSRGNDPVTPNEYGISVIGVDGDEQIPASELLESYKNSEVSKAALTGNRSLPESIFDSIDQSVEGRKAEARRKNESTVYVANNNVQSSDVVTTPKNQYLTQRSLVQDRNSTESDKAKLISIHQDVLNKVKNVEIDTKDGRYPDGVDPLLDENGEAIPVYELGDKLTGVLEEAYKNIYNNARNDTTKFEEVKADREQAKADKTFAESTKESKDTSLASTFESFEMPSVVNRNLATGYYTSINLAKIEAGDAEYYNAFVFGMSSEKKNKALASLNETIKTGRYSYKADKEFYIMGEKNFMGGRRPSHTVTRKVDTSIPLSESDIENFRKVADKIDELTPYTIKDLEMYSSRTISFPHKGMVKDMSDPATAKGVAFTYNTEEEAKRIVEMVQVEYPAYTRQMLESARLKRRTPKETTK